MDWKKWKSVKKEAYESNPNVIKIPKGDLLEAKKLIDKLMSKKIIFWDLETSGFDGVYNQITQIGALVQDPASPIKDTKGLTKNNSFNTKAELHPKMIERLTPGTRENLIWTKEQLSNYMIKNNITDAIVKLPDELAKKYASLATNFLSLGKQEDVDLKTIKQQQENILTQIKQDSAPGKRYQDALSKIASHVSNSIDPRYVFKLTGYGVKGKEKSNLQKKPEHEVLKDFILFLKKHDDGNTYLTGHNIKQFDIKFINARIDSVNKQYDMNLPKPDQMFSGKTFDTVEISRQVFLKSIEKLKEYFDSIRPIALSEDEEVKQKIEKDLETASQEERVQVYNNLLAKIKNDLNNKVIPALTTSSGRLSSSQGILAQALEVDAEGWHDALADVMMLSNVLPAMKILIDLAVSREQPLQEMEPYQKTVTAKHPAAKQRLIGQGLVKDRTSYKLKLSPKRGKSAPPIGE